MSFGIEEERATTGSSAVREPSETPDRRGGLSYPPFVVPHKRDTRFVFCTRTAEGGRDRSFDTEDVENPAPRRHSPKKTELIWQMHLLVRKRFCRSADRFPYSESRFLIGKAGIPACKIDCRSGTGPSRFENPFAGLQSHLPIGKVVSQSATSFPDQQSRLPAGKVVCRSAKSFADRQS